MQCIFLYCSGASCSPIRKHNKAVLRRLLLGQVQPYHGLRTPRQDHARRNHQLSSSIRPIQKHFCLLSPDPTALSQLLTVANSHRLWTRLRAPAMVNCRRPLRTHYISQVELLPVPQAQSSLAARLTTTRASQHRAPS